MGEQRFLGSEQDRHEHLRRIGRHCDGNSGYCTRIAVDQYTVQVTDGFGNVADGTPTEIKRACGRHRLQFVQSGRFKILDTVRISNPHSTERPHWVA